MKVSWLRVEGLGSRV